MRVGDGKRESDGVVPCINQWTADLRKQGIPVVALNAAHYQVTRTTAGAETLARLVRDKQPRWDTARAEKTWKNLFEK